MGSRSELEQRFARRMALVRKAKGLTQTDLARSVGALDRAAISKIESGIRGIGLDEATSIASALGYSVTALAGETPLVISRQVEVR